MVAVAIVLTLGRFYIRWRSSGLGWDDLFNGLALLCLIGFAADPDASDPTTPALWETVLASDLLIWAILWLVKASFLALCWTIFKVSPSFRKAWWIVTVYTFVTFWPCFLAVLWQCGDPLKYNDPQTCLAFQNTQYDYVSLAMTTAFHLSTELFILALSLAFIGRLQMARAQKLSAASVFCIVILTITMGFLRNLSTLYGDFALNNFTYIDLFTSVLEPSVAVIVCALPPYMVLISKFQKRNKALAGAQRNAANRDMEALRGRNRREPLTTLDSIAELERGH